MEREYGWKRFWHRLGDEPQLRLWDDGFLEDPDHPLLGEGPPVKTLNELDEHPCLVLLGEPGMGKSRALRHAAEERWDRPAYRHDRVHAVDLKGASNEQEVRLKLFDNEDFRAWAGGEHRLHWFIDSLDECLLRLDRLALLLADELKKHLGYGELRGTAYDELMRQHPALEKLPPRVVERTRDVVRIHWTRLKREEREQLDAQARQALLERLPAARLHLRLACRTADWQDSFQDLETALAQLGWPEEAPAVYALAPLRRADVSAAARHRSIDPEAFLGEVGRVEAEPLASKPVTLDFLLGQFKASGTRLPGTQAELYERGCRYLCQEEETERPRERHRQFDAARRFAVAARIAAVSIFSGRSSIRTARDEGAGDALAREDLVGQRELVDGNEFDVVASSIEETLSTALFSSGGEGRLRWAHQTYAEFLAAWYLVKQRCLEPKRLLGLILHPHDPERRVIPQLREVAAWMATLDTQVCRELLERDPLVLLRSDISAADKHLLPTLVDALLKLHNDQQGPLYSLGRWRDYPRLSHPGLIEQLRPYLRERTYDSAARQLALNIIEAVGGKDLLSELRQIALDPEESYLLRIRAAQVLTELKDHSALIGLKPLLQDKANTDPDDTLKSIALKALWAEGLLSANEVFDNLTEPKQSDYFGSYQGFIGGSTLWEQLDAEGLRLGLSWLSKEGIWAWEQGIRLEASKLGRLLERAGLNAAHPGTVEAVTAFVKIWLRRGYRVAHREKVLNVFVTDNAFRRLVLDCLLTRFIASREEAHHLILMGREELVHLQDLPWMLQNLREQPSAARQELWVELIGFVHHWRESEFRDEVLSACCQFPSLAHALHMEPIELGSETAAKLREQQQRELARLSPLRMRKEEPSPALSERIAEFLASDESAGAGQWARIVWELERRSAFMWTDERDVRELSGWAELDEGARKQVTLSARRYVLKPDPDAKKQHEANSIHPSVAGYMALRLLITKDDNLSWVPPDAWQRWAPAILEESCDPSTGDEKDAQKLLKLARKHASAEVLRALQRVISNECQKGGPLFIADAVEPLWDEEIAQLLYGQLTTDQSLNSRCKEALLAPLVQHQHPQACALAESWLAPETHRSDEDALTAAKVLLLHGAGASAWNAVWSLFQRAPEHGAHVIESLGHFYSRNEDSWADRFAEHQLADLYIWLWRHFPQPDKEEQPSPPKGVRFLKPGDEVDWWRGRLLKSLKERGTSEAVIAIARIRREFPHLEDLRQAEWDAQELANRNAWEPLNPKTFLDFLNQAGARIVQSPEQLLGVVLESLERLQQRLRGESPAAIHLWSEGHGNRRNLKWPKKEETLSEFVVDHLKQDLTDRHLVIAREVQIRPGELTDIHVVASSTEAQWQGVPIGLIIEVKGCWNPKLGVAMEEQLVNRYLMDNPGRAGIYLVAWFPREQWDHEDSRRRNSRLALDEARARFEAQAQALSRPGRPIAAFVLDASLR